MVKTNNDLLHHNKIYREYSIQHPHTIFLISEGHDLCLFLNYVQCNYRSRPISLIVIWLWLLDYSVFSNLKSLIFIKSLHLLLEVMENNGVANP